MESLGLELREDTIEGLSSLPIFPIRVWDDPVLSELCTEVTDFNDSLSLFAKGLEATMLKNDGLGLAASQVGVLKRIFVMKRYAHDENRKSQILVLCNPKLELSGNMTPGMEGCLSLPGIFDQVPRYPSCTVYYKDVLGKAHQVVLDDLDSRIAQHEIDHLDGIMFFQNMSRNLRKHVLRQWWEKQGK